MLRELGRHAIAIMAVLVLSFVASGIPAQASDGLQTWRFNIEGMT